jgi:glycosyltransferase involved in cell wall biosynthesis
VNATRQITIVHAIARLNVGGAALHVLQLAREQRRRGHEVLVVAGTLAAGEESMEYLADELGVELHTLPALQRELSPRSDLAAVRELRGILRLRQPDVLHTHTAKAGATGRIAALLAGRGRPPAVVHTYHGHVLSGYFDSRRERIFRLVERVLARATDALVAVSDEVRDDLVGFGVAPADKFTVVPYGFDLPPWSGADDSARARVRAELGIGDDTFVVGWAGRLTPIKRPLDLVRTLRALLDLGVDAQLVLVGDGADRPAVEALAATLDVSDRSRLVGFQRGMREWFAAFDAVLLTSANEGTPVVAIEALAAERAVVATRAGGTSTVVIDGESGYLEEIGDTRALAGRLAELQHDPERRAALGRHGAEDVRGRFATARMAAELETVYGKALSR